MSTLEAVICILGLPFITLATRGFFLWPERDLPIPAWLREGLRFAPLAALVAVAMPEIILSDGKLIDTWRDPRLAAVAVASLWYLWRRTLLGTIVTGTAVMLALRLGLGW